MKLFSLFERRSVENPSYPLSSATLMELFSGTKTSAGVYVSESTAHRVSAIYRAWSLIAGTIGSLPLKTFVGDPPGGDPWSGDTASLLAYPGGRDPLTGIPNPGAPSAMVFYETAVQHLLSWGNCYIVKVPNIAGGGRTVALDLLLPSQVVPRWVKRTQDNPSGKEFVISPGPMLATPHEGPMIATPRDVIHVRAMGSSLLLGISPIGAHRQGLGLAVAAEEYGARLFGNGILMGGVLQTDKALDQPTADALKARWMARLSGLAHAHETAILDNGAKWVPTPMPQADSQFIASRKFQVVEIARLYGIPPHLLGDVERSTSWGTGIEFQGLSFNMYTLRPWLARLEQALSNELLPRGVNCRFSVDEILRADIETRYRAYQIGIGNGFMTPNEVRAKEGWKPLDGGDDLMFPANYTTVQALADPPAPVAPVLALPAPPGGADVSAAS